MARTGALLGARIGRGHLARLAVASLAVTGLVLVPTQARVAQPARAAAGVVQKIIAQANDIRAPYGMEISPDGRLWLLEQQRGAVRIVKNDVLLPTPFMTLPVEVGGSRGLISMVFDPAFGTNHFLYVQYTTSTTVGGVKTIFNRVSRFTANGDVVVPGSEQVVWDGLPLDDKTMHYGGGLWFGTDGKLYLSLGDRLLGPNAQNMGTQWGKILRINPDGTIPTDNPFYATTTGKNKAIWALGLRNPWQSEVRKSTSEAYISDVGSATWEEIDKAARGANFGWPTYEGTSHGAPGYSDPVWYYNHSTGDPFGCAVVGADFYEPTTAQWPSIYRGTLFVADLCQGWLKSVDVDHGNTVRDVASGFEQPVDVKVGQQGQVYVLTRVLNGVAGGALIRLDYNPNAPLQITSQPQPQTGAIGGSATFTVEASGGAGSITYQWQRDGVNIAGATGNTYTISGLTVSDDGAHFRVKVSDGVTTLTSNAALLTVTANQAPAATITTPVVGQTYRAGETLTWSGSGSDPEDGTIPASRMTWSVVFHHNTHTHDFVLPYAGATSGSAVIPVDNETSTDVWYRVHLTVTDSAGASTEVTRDVVPRLATVTLNSTPTAMRMTLDGQPVTTPLTFSTVQGIHRHLAPITPQTHAGASYAFSAWTDGAPASRVIAPWMDRTFTATFSTAAAPRALLVVGNSVSPAVGETVIQNQLAALGFNVSLLDDSAAAGANLSGVALVAISNTAAETLVGTTFKSKAVPVLIWKSGLYDQMGMTAGTVGANGVKGGVTNISVAGPHPALGTLTGVSVDLVTAAGPVPWGQPGASADVLASVGTLPVLFDYQAGDALVGGGTAAGCRVAFPLWSTTAPNFTATAWSLFDTTVRFTTDGCTA